MFGSERPLIWEESNAFVPSQASAKGIKSIFCLVPGRRQGTLYADRHAGRKTDRKTDRHISARTDRQADRRMDRQREKQTDILAKRRGLASFALGSVAKWRTLTQIIVILDILILAYSGPGVKGALSPVKDIMIFKMMSMSPRSVGLHSAFKEP